MDADRRQQRAAALSAGGHEAWELEVTDVAAGLGLGVGVVLVGTGCWFWAILCGRGRPPTAVIDDQVPAPGWPNVEVRTTGLWAELGIHDPGRHLSVDCEAFGLAVDDPDELLGDARGTRVPFGLDVEWHRRPGREPVSLDDGHRIDATVEGEILVGAETLELGADAAGSWEHRWGDGPWWGPTRNHTSSATTDAGTSVAAAAVAVGGWAWRQRLVERGETLGWDRTVLASPDGRVAH